MAAIGEHKGSLIAPTDPIRCKSMSHMSVACRTEVSLLLGQLVPQSMWLTTQMAH